MARTAIGGLVIALTLAAIVVFAPSREGADIAPERRASDEALASALALGSLAADAELERRSAAMQDADERTYGPASARSRLELPFNGFVARGGPQRRVDRIDDLRWRAFDQQFRKTPFDRAIDMLPFRKPPLRVVQWVTDSPPDTLRTKAQRERFYRMSQRARDAAVVAYYRSAPHRLYARVDRDVFFRMSLREREAAVKAFYRKARPWFERAGIKDFELVVTPWTPTLEHLPAYAIGRGDAAKLTSLGRGERPRV